MRRFSFSLESVFIVRQKALDDERIQLAKLLNAYNKQNQVLSQMLSALEDVKNENEQYLLQNEINPFLLSNYSSFSNKLIQDIKTQQLIIKKTKQDLSQQQEKTKQAYIALKTLEKLKEKQKEKYEKEAFREEIKELDDIVNSKRKSA